MRRFKSDAYEAIHEEVRLEFEAGLTSEARMKEYDELCLVQEPDASYEATPVTREPVTAVLG